MSKKLTLDNFIGGISPSDRLGPEGSFYQGTCASSLPEPGYIQPGNSGTEVTNSSVIENPINSKVIEPSNLNFYLIESYLGNIGIDANLQQGDVSGAGLTDDSDFPHTIGSDLTGHVGHTNFDGEDVIIYNYNGTNYLFYSWNDSNDGDIGQVELSGTLSFEDDWYTNTAGGSVLTNGEVHQFLEWQGNGNLYCTNGRYIVEIDGETPSVTDQAFKLPPGWHATTIFDAGDTIGIGASYNPGSGGATYLSRAAVFFWNGVDDTKFVRKVFIPDEDIRASITLDGIPYLLTESNDFIDYIRAWNGNTFKLVNKIDANIYYSSDAPKSFGGVALHRNGIAFTSPRVGDILWYGAPYVGADKRLFHIGKTKYNWANAILDLNGILVVSSDDAQSNATVEILNSDGNNDFLFKTLYYEFPSAVKINYIRLFFNTLESGTDDDIKIETDYGDTTYTKSHNGDMRIAYAGDGAIHSKRFNVGIMCHNFRVIIDTDEANASNGVRYSKIVVDYDYISDK